LKSSDAKTDIPILPVFCKSKDVIALSWPNL